jgi:hypothetical protein
MKYLLLSLMALFSLKVYSQDTTFESTKKWKDHWNAAFNYSYMDVNSVEQHLLNMTYNNDYVKDYFDLVNACNYTLLIRSNSTVTNDFSYKIQPRFFIDKIYIFDYVQISSIYSRKIDIRYENLLGIGYYIIKNKNIKTSISYGCLYQNSKFINDSTNILVRHSVRFQINGSNKNMNYFLETYYQPELFNASNTNYSYTAKISYKIDKKLSFNISLIKNYEQSVYISSTPTSNSNTNLLFGLSYTY